MFSFGRPSNNNNNKQKKMKCTFSYTTNFTRMRARYSAHILTHTHAHTHASHTYAHMQAHTHTKCCAQIYLKQKKKYYTNIWTAHKLLKFTIKFVFFSYLSPFFSSKNGKSKQMSSEITPHVLCVLYIFTFCLRCVAVDDSHARVARSKKFKRPNLAISSFKKSQIFKNEKRPNKGQILFKKLFK